MHTYERTQTTNIHNEQRTRAAATPKNERAQGNMKITATRTTQQHKNTERETERERQGERKLKERCSSS